MYSVIVLLVTQFLVIMVIGKSMDRDDDDFKKEKYAYPCRLPETYSSTINIYVRYIGKKVMERYGAEFRSIIVNVFVIL